MSKRMYANLGVLQLLLWDICSHSFPDRWCTLFFWSHTLIPWERVHGNLAFIEADVCNHFTICTEIEGAVIAEFFFIYPVRNTVEYLCYILRLSLPAIRCYQKQFDKVDVVVAHKRNPGDCRVRTKEPVADRCLTKVQSVRFLTLYINIQL